MGWATKYPSVHLKLCIECIAVIGSTSCGSTASWKCLDLCYGTEYVQNTLAEITFVYEVSADIWMHTNLQTWVNWSDLNCGKMY